MFSQIDASACANVTAVDTNPVFPNPSCQGPVSPPGTFFYNANNGSCPTQSNSSYGNFTPSQNRIGLLVHVSENR
jgi:hypothetical protein